MTGSGYDDEHDPFLRLIEAVFAGAYGNYKMPIEERLKWTRKYLPQTYALIANGSQWELLTDI